MLPEDSLDAAVEAARPFTDERMRHFYDPAQEAGRAIAESLKWERQVARDIYLFYAPGQQWGDLPPPPADYTHQLTNAWADRDHYLVTADLARELSGTMEKMLQG